MTLAIHSPRIRAAAERRGMRTDDVYFTSYDFASRQITLRHGEICPVSVEGFGTLRRLCRTGEDVFTLDDDE